MYQESELTKSILQSDKAKELLNNVPPIYSDGYVALWLFEVIGRELDLLTTYYEDYERQIFPKTVTWSIDLWEEKMGISGRSDLSLEQRRQILLNTILTKPMTPQRLAELVSGLVGFDVKVLENTGTNMFTLDCQGNVSTEMLARIHREIDDKKPAHLVFDVRTATAYDAPITVYKGAGITLQRTISLEVTE